MRSIGASAFESTALSDLWLPTSVALVGPRAFAANPSLERVVALGSSEVAPDALAECSGTTVYCPAASDGSWNVGLPAAGNHLAPYGVSLPETPLSLEVGQSASLFEGGSLESPEGVPVSYAYSAKPVSVDQDGLVSATAEGVSDVAVALTLDGKDIARATRTAEVAAAPKQETSDENSATPSSEQVESNFAPDPASSPETPAPLMLSAQVSLMAAAADPAMAVGSTFEQQVNGTWYRFTVQSLDQTAKIGGVTVGKSADASKEPFGTIQVPEKVSSDGFAFAVVGVTQSGFANCGKITSVVLPATVETVYSFGFDGCGGMTALPAMPGVKKLLWNSFRNCSALREVNLPDSLSLIEGLAFEQCAAVTSVRIPKSVSSIGGGAFAGCNEMASLTVDPANASFYAADGALCAQATGKLVDCGAAKAFSENGVYRIPEGVKAVGTASFKYVDWLSGLVMPSTVTAVESAAFDSMPNLAEVLCLAPSLSLLQTTASQNGSFFRSSKPDVYCPASAVGAWSRIAVASTTSLDIRPPTSIALPDNRGSVSVMFDCGIPATSLFESGLTWQHTVGSSDVSVRASADGRTVALSYGSAVNATQLTSTLSYGGLEMSTVTTPVTMAATSGPLPTTSHPDNADKSVASWELSADGVLTIKSAEEVKGFDWAYNAYDKVNGQYWGPLRASVRAIDTTGLAAVPEMNCWFQKMPLLMDISKVVIPQGTIEVINTFAGSGITEIPEDFGIPEGVTSVHALFNGCRGIASIPDTFALPKSLDDCSFLFGGNPNLTGLPDTFKIPDGVTKMGGFFRSWTGMTSAPSNFSIPKGVEEIGSLFEGCSNLVSVPSNIVLPEGVKNADYLFKNCPRLESLPDNFRIPSTVTRSWGTFYGCDSLTVLPAGFTTPRAGMSNTSPFYCSSTKPLYYAGSDPLVLGATAEWWASQNRTLVTPQAGSVEFKLPTKTGEGWEMYTALTPDASGMLAEPAAPERADQVFTLWYADEACTQRFDFSKPIADQIQAGAAGKCQIYGRYAAGTRGGQLPTVGGTGSASWSISDEGTLYIRGAGEIADFGWDWNVPAMNTEHWGAYRSLVKSVAMAPSLKAKRMRSWFMSMGNLADLRDVFIPEGALDVSRLFGSCRSLKTLPEGFVIPNGTTQTMAMFENSGGLTSLPEGFSIPDTVTITSGMFRNCASLSSIPDSFKLPKAATYWIDSMFFNCSSLTSLPDSFSFPNAAYANAGTKTFYCDLRPDGSRAPLYYGGSDPVVLACDWEAQNRTLVTDAADAEGFGMQRATFKVQSATPDESGAHAWETRGTAWSNKRGILANPGELQLDGYTFTGWCADEDCLVSFDFSKPLPEGGATIYGKWVIGGGFDAKLPLEEGTTGDAWWRVTADGVLSIEGEGKVSGVGWGVDDRHLRYWGPYRDQVRAIRMGGGVRVGAMPMWFSRMPNLVDLSGFAIPEGTKSANDLFEDCPALERLPEDFRLPDSLETVMGMFSKCSSLKEIPEGFKLGPNVEYGNWLFNRCSSLRTLPPDFVVPKATAVANNMFSECTSLESLPEGFGFEDPASVRTVAEMFNLCPNLRYLPASFKTAGLSDAAKASMGTMFKVSGSTPLKTYYAGDAADLYSENGYWKSQNRELVAAVPAGKVRVDLMVPDRVAADGVPSWEAWTSLVVDAGTAFAEPAVSSREGSTFVGWRIGPEEGAAAYDFAKAPAENGVAVVDGAFPLYAAYQENRGKLPTLGPDGTPGGDAEWFFDAATGELSIRCTAEGAVIQHLFDDFDGEVALSHWRPVRNLVKRVAVDPGVDAVDLKGWFATMDALEEARLNIPASAKSVQGLFQGCSSLRTLPDGFTIPDNVWQVSHLFQGCASLKSLPEGFRLPAVVEDEGAPFGLNNVFYECLSLESLPQGFAVPEVRTGTVDGMFYGCASLRALPEGFTFADAGPLLKEVIGVFAGCSSLASLPDGFALPPAGRVYKHMFMGCTSLVSLPEGFRFEAAETVTNVEGMFLDCPSLKALPASLNLSDLAGYPLWDFESMFALTDRSLDDPLPTLYLKQDGEQKADLDRLLAPNRGSSDPVAFWRGKFGRALFAEGDSESQLPTGVRAVTFKTRTAGDAGWTVSRTVLTDAEGRVPDLGTPSRFGYAFSGWCAEESCAASSRFDFANGRVKQDAVLYGTYSMLAEVAVPLQAKIEIDASGTVKAAPFVFESAAPVSMRVSGVSGELAAGASRLFPREGDAKAVELVVSAGRSSIAILPGSDAPEERAGGLSGVVGAAAPGAPGVLAGSVDLVLNGAQVDYQPGEDMTSFARLSWTIEAA